MSDEEKEWILPASIPFAELKGRDLEECLYWLLDAMGAKDLEWCTGGSGGGASDGGRDLEAHFYTPTADQEVEPQVWWVECKGRSGTVEPDEVKSAVINAQARRDLDYVVIATNTQFSNPTRDWVKEWQKKNPRPKVKLWDRSHLERLLSRHPDVVLRLFPKRSALTDSSGAGIAVLEQARICILTHTEEALEDPRGGRIHIAWHICACRERVRQWKHHASSLGRRA